MIPRLRPRLGWTELWAALRPGRRNDVADFEHAFAAEFGVKHAVAFPYGRTGMIALFQALGLEDKEVICPAYTCVVVPHAIVYSGNTPAFVDCADDDFNMDLNAAEAAITADTGAIVATSLFGYPVDLDRLDKIKQRHPHVTIVQDCAHSFSAEWRGRPVQQHGAAAVFGLNISKLMTSIFGGMVTTDDDELAERLRATRAQMLQPPGWSKSLRRLLYLLAVYPAFWPPLYTLVYWLQHSGILNRFVRYYEDDKIDMPADYLVGMTDLEARVGMANLARYRTIVADRRANAAHYDQALINIDGLTLPPKVEGATYSHYVPLVDDRATWMTQAAQRGVQLGQLIEYNCADMKAYTDYQPNDCPRARELAQITVNLPVWMGDAAHARRVVRSIHPTQR